MKATNENQNKKLTNLEDQKVKTENVKGGRQNRTNPILEENSHVLEDKFGATKVDAGGRIKAKLGKKDTTLRKDKM